MSATSWGMPLYTSPATFNNVRTTDRLPRLHATLEAIHSRLKITFGLKTRSTCTGYRVQPVTAVSRASDRLARLLVCVSNRYSIQVFAGSDRDPWHPPAPASSLLLELYWPSGLALWWVRVALGTGPYRLRTYIGDSGVLSTPVQARSSHSAVPMVPVVQSYGAEWSVDNRGVLHHTRLDHSTPSSRRRCRPGTWRAPTTTTMHARGVRADNALTDGSGSGTCASSSRSLRSRAAI